MSDIFAEVDEAIKQERLEKIWADYKGVIITFIVGIILLTAIVSAYNSWDATAKEQQTAALGALLDAEDFPANIDLETLDLHGDVRAMALMSAGASLLQGEEPNTEKAATYYSAVADDKKISTEFRELATLMHARLSGDNTADAQKALETIYNNEDSLWRYHAALELAVLSAHADKDLEQARKYLAEIRSEQSIPANLIARAKSLDHVYVTRQNQK